MITVQLRLAGLTIRLAPLRMVSEEEMAQSALAIAGEKYCAVVNRELGLIPILGEALFRAPEQTAKTVVAAVLRGTDCKP